LLAQMGLDIGDFTVAKWLTYVPRGGRPWLAGVQGFAKFRLNVPG
jgi:hypothetical protein